MANEPIKETKSISGETESQSVKPEDIEKAKKKGGFFSDPFFIVE
jgi:hypothetical protein